MNNFDKGDNPFYTTGNLGGIQNPGNGLEEGTLLHQKKSDALYKRKSSFAFTGNRVEQNTKSSTLEKVFNSGIEEKPKGSYKANSLILVVLAFLIGMIIAAIFFINSEKAKLISVATSSISSNSISTSSISTSISMSSDNSSSSSATSVDLEIRDILNRLDKDSILQEFDETLDNDASY